MNTESLLNLKEYYFLSPHFDDVILSCGELLQQINTKATIHVITLFSEGGEEPYTLSAKQYLKASHVYNANILYKARKAEDKKVFNSLHIQTTELGLTDALFRKNNIPRFLGNIIPEFIHLYPTYRWHVKGTINPYDTSFEIVKEKLQRLIPKSAYVFTPYNIAGHVDHFIAKKTAEELFKNLIYYSEFPYNVRQKNYGERRVETHFIELSVNLEKKRKLISFYQTQLDGLFENRYIPQHKEVYFYNQ